jgi:hypothetical protein
MSAEERARNDLPPPAAAAGSFDVVSDRLRLLVIDAQIERMATGRRGDRLDSVNRLVALGVLPPVPLDENDPIARTVDAAVRQKGGIRGLRPFLQELRAALPHGLVVYAKSAQVDRAHGFNGLTATGRRSIRDACTLLDERQGALATGLVTLPDGHADTVTRDQLATYQSRWLYYARRMLKRVGLPPLVLIVAEWHPHRRTMGGAPIIHWHWVAPVSHGPYQAWVAKTGDWHHVASLAYRSAFGVPRPNTHGCGAQPIRKSCGRYLSKYLAKGRSQAQELRGTEHERCVPRQWWTWTGELRRKVNACRSHPPARFLAWCVRWRSHLEALGEVTAGQVTIGEDGPALGWWFGWRSLEALERAIAQWIEEELACIDHRARAGPDQGDIGPDPGLWREADEEGVLIALPAAARPSAAKRP